MLAHRPDGHVGLPGGHVRLAERVEHEGAVGGLGERVGVLQVGGHHQGGLGRRARQVREVDRLQQLGEGADLGQVGLGGAGVVGQPEVHLEGVVPVGVLVGQVVVVGVVPGQPAARPGQQAGVQHLAVVVAGVLRRREAGADAELLQHHRLAGEAGQLAGEGRPQVQPDPVRLHPVDVGADEVDQRRGGPQREAVVDPAQLDPQAPSPSDTGWVPPPARTACTSSSAQAVTTGTGPGRRTAASRWTAASRPPPGGRRTAR